MHHISLISFSILVFLSSIVFIMLELSIDTNILAPTITTMPARTIRMMIEKKG